MLHLRHNKRQIIQLTVLTLAFIVALCIALLPAATWRHRVTRHLAVELSGAHLASSQPSAVKADRTAYARLSEAYGKLPLSFEANRGQTDEEVKFLSRGAGYTFFLTSNEAVMELRRADRTYQNEESTFGDRQSELQTSSSAVLRMQIVGADPAAHIEGREQLAGKSNYLTGNSPRQWRRDVPTYARVQYEAVYPGVDLVYYGNQQQLEYDFILQPGADPRQIKLAFSGVEEMEVDAGGDLVLQTAAGEVRQRKPMVYQAIAGQKQEVASSYVISGSQELSFQVGEYDRSKPLIIDPVLVYSTYLGGSNSESARDIAVDVAGNVYVTGTTLSTN